MPSSGSCYKLEVMIVRGHARTCHPLLAVLQWQGPVEKVGGEIRWDEGICNNYQAPGLQANP